MSPRWQPLPSDRGPRKIGEGLDRVVPGGRAFTTLRDRWKEIAGDAVAARSRPAALHATTLVIHLDDNAWQAQFRFMEQDLLRRIEEAIGAGLVTEIRTVVRPS